MKTITMKKDVLFNALRENRAQHRSIFLEAQKGYRREAIKALDMALEQARTGGAIRLSFGLVAPVDHTEDYDLAIAMLGHHTEDTLEISMDDYDNYVQDNWVWKSHFLTTNSTYIVN